jgi:hypothetical protein
MRSGVMTVMARIYWLAYRIADHGPYRATWPGRYQALESAVAFVTDTVLWKETPSFILFDSEETLDEIRSHIGKAIDASVDLAVLCDPEAKTGSIIGTAQDDDIFTLLPFMKKDECACR